MAISAMFQALYASLLSQALYPSSPPPTAGPTAINGYRPMVQTPYGNLLGVQTRTASNELVDSFLGIPFAQPPVGKLRFREPLPASAWSGIRDASTFGNECHERSTPEIYFNVTDNPPKKSEDCLYLNVYKPVQSSKDLLPVMVWIHGGGFFLGAGSQYDGTELATNGVIVVTTNYRLEVFGFLSNQDDVIPGNYGMLDQVMALKWVQENIQSFGGDPNMVTIFGESAGSASVSFLTLSPLAKGLFQRAIMESGTSLSPWANKFPSSRIAPRQVVSLIGSLVGCYDSDATKRLECLRNVDAVKLLNASIGVGSALGDLILMPPVVETQFGFLPDLPINLWTQNKFNHVDMLRGFNKAENGQDAILRGNYSIFYKNFTTFVKPTFNNFAVMGLDKLLQDMARVYIGNETDGHKMLLEVAYAISDINFKGSTLVEANIESQIAPEKKHYVYQFDYKPGMSEMPSWMPPIHGEELQFVFGVNLRQFQLLNDKSPSVTDQTMSRAMQTLWTNFAKYGDPTRTVPASAVKWDTYDAAMARVMKINMQSIISSFKNHNSLYFYPTILKKFDSTIPDKFIVG